MNNFVYQRILRLELPWDKLLAHKTSHGNRMGAHGISKQPGIDLSNGPEGVRSVMGGKADILQRVSYRIRGDL